jgi:hypothetical protein
MEKDNLKHTCEYDRVVMKTVMRRTRSCKRKASVCIGGKWYCSLHTPDQIKKEWMPNKKNRKLNLIKKEICSLLL